MLSLKQAAIAGLVRMSLLGTKRTNRVDLAMSIPRGRPEVARKAKFGSD